MTRQKKGEGKVSEREKEEETDDEGGKKRCKRSPRASPQLSVSALSLTFRNLELLGACEPKAPLGAGAAQAAVALAAAIASSASPF